MAQALASGSTALRRHHRASSGKPAVAQDCCCCCCWGPCPAPGFPSVPATPAASTTDKLLLPLLVASSTTSKPTSTPASAKGSTSMLLLGNSTTSSGKVTPLCRSRLHCQSHCLVPMGVCAGSANHQAPQAAAAATATAAAGLLRASCCCPQAWVVHFARPASYLLQLDVRGVEAVGPSSIHTRPAAAVAWTQTGENCKQLAQLGAAQLPQIMGGLYKKEGTATNVSEMS